MELPEKAVQRELEKDRHNTTTARPRLVSSETLREGDTDSVTAQPAAGVSDLQP